MRPEKTACLGRGRRSVAPLFLVGRTERPDRTGTNNTSFDVDGQHRRWVWTPICRGMCKRYHWYWFGWRGPGFCMMDPNTFFCIGSERMTTSIFVPFRSFPFSWAWGGLRHALTWPAAPFLHDQIGRKNLRFSYGPILPLGCSRCRRSLLRTFLVGPAGRRLTVY